MEDQFHYLSLSTFATVVFVLTVTSVLLTLVLMVGLMDFLVD
jgi:hypothetical protein